jgi:hypothetical protein
VWPARTGYPAVSFPLQCHLLAYKSDSRAFSSRTPAKAYHKPEERLFFPSASSTNKQPVKMTEKQNQPTQFTPRFRTDIYPYIYPSKFKGSLQGKVAIITGMRPFTPFSPPSLSIAPVFISPIVAPTPTPTVNQANSPRSPHQQPPIPYTTANTITRCRRGHRKSPRRVVCRGRCGIGANIQPHAAACRAA